MAEALESVVTEVVEQEAPAREASAPDQETPAPPKKATRRSGGKKTAGRKAEKVTLPLPEGYSGQRARQEYNGADALKKAIANKEILSVTITHTTADKIFVLLGEAGVGDHLMGVMTLDEFDERRYAGYEGFVGEQCDVIVLGFDPVDGVAQVSRRQAREIKLKQLLDSGFGLGSVVQGVVRSVQPYAAFVDIGGLHAILPINEITFGYIDHPGDVLQRGDLVEVKVIQWDPKTLKARVSIKALSDPWAKVGSLYEKNAIVLGEISGMRDAQIWVRPQVYNGVEILCPAMPHRRYEIGQKVRVRLMTVSPETQRLRGKIIGRIR